MDGMPYIPPIEVLLMSEAFSPDALCLGTDCPKKAQCARASSPRTRKHYTIVPYNKRAKMCRYFLAKKDKTKI